MPEEPPVFWGELGKLSCDRLAQLTREGKWVYLTQTGSTSL